MLALLRRILIALLPLLIGFGQCNGKLMAIDLGGEFLKVSVVAPGRSPITIAINEMSRRKTPILAGFVDGQRIVGEEAVTMSVRHPDTFFKLFRDLIGKPADDPAVSRMLEDNLLPYDIVPDPQRGTVRIQVPKYERSFTIEELLATEISYAHSMAEKHIGASIQACVVLIPPFFGVHQRRAVIDAVGLTNVPLLSLMHTHAAAALQYGIERDFKGRTEHVVLLDVASSDTVAALVRYSDYKVKGNSKKMSQFQVLDVAWREGAGASTLDAKLVRHFAAKFVEQHGTEDILQNRKTVAKMGKPIRRTKEILSANMDAPFIVEELYNGIDFSSSLSRTEFEEIAGPYWEQVKEPLAELLARNNLTNSQDFTLQLLGGGSRIPRVQAELAGMLEGLKLEKQLDADEAMALGGGLFAANMSSTFRLRPYGMHDGNVFPINITLASGPGIPEEHQDFFPENGGKELLPYMRKLGTKRKVTFTGVTADPFTVSLVYAGERKPCCLASDKIVSFLVSGMKDVVQRYGDSGKVVLYFQLDANGVLSMTGAEARIEKEEMTEVEKLVPADEADANATDSTQESAPEQETTEDVEQGDASEEEVKADGETDSSSANTTDAENSTKDSGNSTQAAPKMKKVKVWEKVIKPRVVTLQVGEEWHGPQVMSADDKLESTELLALFAAEEHAKQETALAKNNLEAYIINTRSSLNDDEDVQKVTTEEQRDTFKASLTEMEDWLYMDPEADAAAAEVFVSKLALLTAVGDPIKLRVYEMQRRPERMETALKLTEIVGKAVNSWPDTKPWLNSTRVESLKTQAEEFESWLKDVDERQSKLELHESPAYTVAELQDRFEVVSKLFAKLNSIPAPAPPPAIPSPTNSTANATTNSTTSEEASASTDSENASSQADDHDELR